VPEFLVLLVLLVLLALLVLLVELLLVLQDLLFLVDIILISFDEISMYILYTNILSTYMSKCTKQQEPNLATSNCISTYKL
jgi:hypothetical protein